MKKIVLVFILISFYSLSAFSQRYTSKDLIKAISNGSENSVINAIIDSGVNVNATGSGGNTPLIIATDKGYLETVNKLIEAGANVDIANNASRTPLYISALKGYAAITKALIKAGANVNVKDIKIAGQTPLMVAAWSGHTEIAEALIEAGANVNARMVSDFIIHNKIKYEAVGTTSLLIASWYGHVQIVKLLLDAGADVNVVIKRKGKYYTPMSNADSIEIINILKAAGAKE